ncbi:aminotransferase class I/II-fold pyridoxal phosphate-dependent enzyme [Streptomyces albidus (ex Kaewkla and Franco 2022)]|uniref:aminotransferase class I/II-fold pyridoxal phosphate-dependent enzyme n=1 Tax=Streptomyces albidus (ex Kaewkla and Franco 2022) TaxID=722709 RepID=UPI0015EFBAB4|nr:PLP-dependent aminotransferase family protein [Streptomyces albidus (ex Kaewkla and Franco 2022)]
MLRDDHRVATAVLTERISPPTARAIASVVARMIREDDLRVGDLLPKVRDLAEELKVSPSTVSAAWTLLRQRGLVSGRGKAGVEVASPDLAPVTDSAEGTVPVRHDLRLVLPDAALLPRLDRALLHASAQPGLSEYDKAGIAPALETASRRIWPYECESLITASGSSDGLWLVLRALSVPGDRVLLEAPGSPPVIRIVRSLGLIPVEVESGPDGPSPAGLARGLKSDPVALVFQPRAQVPTGAVTSLERLGELAAVLRRSRCAVIEFDDIGDVSTAPDRSIGAHLPGRTVVVKSFEKSYGPDLRMAVIGGTEHFITGIHGHMLLERQWTSRILQVTLAWLLTDDATQRQIRVSREAYGQRLAALSASLARAGLPIDAKDGLCAWIPVRDEDAAVAASAAEGVLMYPGRHSFPSEQGGFVRVATSRLVDGYDEVARVIRLAADAV